MTTVRNKQKSSLVIVSTKIAVWLEKSADICKADAAKSRGRFDGLAEACLADEALYRRMAAMLRAALSEEDRK